MVSGYAVERMKILLVNINRSNYEYLFGIKHLEFYSLLLYDYLCNSDRFMSTYTGPPDDTIMSKLIHEWLMFLHNGDTSYVSLTKIATNLFEAVVEYSIISSKLITLQQKDVVMLK